MSMSGLRITQSLKPQMRPSIYWTLSDALVLAKRHLVQVPRRARRPGAGQQEDRRTVAMVVVGQPDSVLSCHQHEGPPPPAAPAQRGP